MSAEFEQTLHDLITKAVDGSGRAVALHAGSITADALRRSTRLFMGPLVDDGAVFLNGCEAPTREQQLKSEAAMWDNLALLARATAAAVRAEL